MGPMAVSQPGGRDVSDEMSRFQEAWFMTFQQLKYGIAMAETGSITEASRVCLSLSQPFPIR